jgi:predicted ester cyclase
MSSKSADPQRRRALVRAHYAVENGHDIDAIMGTFAATGEMHYNRQPFTDLESIRAAHIYMGFDTAGAFAGLQTLAEHEHLTDDEIVIEGRLLGKHVGEFQGFAPTGRDVELPFVAFYRFDADGKLTSERVVMNLAPLAAMS